MPSRAVAGAIKRVRSLCQGVVRKMALSPIEKVLPFSLTSNVLGIPARIFKDALFNNEAPRPHEYRLCLCGRQSCIG